MNRRHIKWLPIGAALLFIAYQYFSSEKFVNPETGRKSHVALSAEQESALGLQSYQQILAQSQTIDSGPEVDMVRRVVQRLAGATGEAGKSFDWRVSLVQSDKINAFCLPGGKIVVYTGILPVANSEAALVMKWRTLLPGMEPNVFLSRTSLRQRWREWPARSRTWITKSR